MSDHKDLTGRDAYVIVQALTFTIEELSGLPFEHRPDNNIADMKRLVDDFVKQDASLSVSQSIAHNRLKNVLKYIEKSRGV
jgi:hypothetical protein